MNTNAHILAAADRCVMCGLCLPHCPTYQLHHSEAESPRGRIALMQALAAGQLKSSPVLQRHLDSCLVCRACEKMCPSKVPYGQLIDATRAQLRKQGKPSPPPLKRLLAQVEEKKKLQRSGMLLRGYQQSGFQTLIRGGCLLKVLGLEEHEAQLPQIPLQQSLAVRTPAQGERRGRIGLFTGCIGSLLEGEVHRAAIKLLSRLGYEVHVPVSQGCCGSLHQHNGEPQKAGELAQKNIGVFDCLKLDAVVSTASGCAAQLSEYPALYGERTTPFYEICDFLTNIEWPESVQLKPLPQKALLHLPCNQRNVLQRPDAVTTLLARIPQLQCEPLAENHLCCGSAGSYQLTQRDNAEALRERKLDLIAGTNAQLLLSNNLGCALHLQNGLRQRGMKTKLLHPLLLLQQALG
ncbi:MAG: (Fe-S)-binding protein [Pseudomonadota bacterium]